MCLVYALNYSWKWQVWIFIVGMKWACAEYTLNSKYDHMQSRHTRGNFIDAILKVCKWSWDIHAQITVVTDSSVERLGVLASNWLRTFHIFSTLYIFLTIAFFQIFSCFSSKFSGIVITESTLAWSLCMCTIQSLNISWYIRPKSFINCLRQPFQQSIHIHTTLLCRT